jgi:hypothetical protein
MHDLPCIASRIASWLRSTSLFRQLRTDRPGTVKTTAVQSFAIVNMLLRCAPPDLLAAAPRRPAHRWATRRWATRHPLARRGLPSAAAPCATAAAAAWTACVSEAEQFQQAVQEAVAGACSAPNASAEPELALVFCSSAFVREYGQVVAELRRLLPSLKAIVGSTVRRRRPARSCALLPPPLSPPAHHALLPPPPRSPPAGLRRHRQQRR